MSGYIKAVKGNAMSPLDHPIPIESREDADAFYAMPDMLFFVAVSRALRKRSPQKTSGTKGVSLDLRRLKSAA